MEERRAENLRDAQTKAERLFKEVEARELIRAGITEKSLNEEIYALAEELFGITKYWHKRIVRAGRNTLAPYAVNPPDLTIQPDDIAFLDFGPVFDKWEADFGRTYVVGADPLKIKLRDDVAAAFTECKTYYEQNPEITASELFAHACELARRTGWEFGGAMAGHLIGRFPHERITGDKVSLYIHPENKTPMRSLDKRGHVRHWILEIHFVDRRREIGAFFEELLTV